MAKDLSQITFEFSDKDERPKGVSFGAAITSFAENKINPRRKSLKEIYDDDPVEIPEDEILFQKAYYGIGEVAQMFKLNVSQVRLWENEFDILEPKKNRKGDRYFRPVDIKNLQLIYDLIRRRKFTMEGAKEFMKKNEKAKEAYELIASLQKIKTFLMELKANL